MIVTTKTTIGFKMPEEYKQALKFGEEHKDWIKSEDTVYIAYKTEKMYSVELSEDGEE